MTTARDLKLILEEASRSSDYIDQLVVQLKHLKDNSLTSVRKVQVDLQSQLASITNLVNQGLKQNQQNLLEVESFTMETLKPSLQKLWDKFTRTSHETEKVVQSLYVRILELEAKATSHETEKAVQSLNVRILELEAKASSPKSPMAEFLKEQKAKASSPKPDLPKNAVEKPIRYVTGSSKVTRGSFDSLKDTAPLEDDIEDDEESVEEINKAFRDAANEKRRIKRKNKRKARLDVKRGLKGQKLSQGLSKKRD